MGWYRRLIFDSFSLPRNPILESISSTSFHICSSKPIFSRSRISEISQPSILQNGLKKNQQTSTFLDGAKRFYSEDHRQQVSNSKPITYKRWFENPRNKALIAVLVGSGVVITLYFGCLETIIYIKRKHFLILPIILEKKEGEDRFKKIKVMCERIILPSHHPKTVRVRRITVDIILALEKGLKIDQDKYFQPQHLKGLKWEVIVVNSPDFNAYCLPGGKVVVFAGLLEHAGEDCEIATAVAHEIAHLLARHHAELFSKETCLGILQKFLHLISLRSLIFFRGKVIPTTNYFLWIPSSQRMEIEADCIGLLLVASAGYDPRRVPPFYLKMERFAGDWQEPPYRLTHPPGHKRAQFLDRSKVMEHALYIYREVQAGRQVEGFLTY